MALPASGPLSINNINVELGKSGTTTSSLGQTDFRTLAGVASGTISMSNFYGKANWTSYSFAAYNVNKTLGWSGNTTISASATLISGRIFNALPTTVNVTTPNNEVFGETLWTVTFYARIAGTSTEISQYHSGQYAGSRSWTCGSVASYPNGFDQLRVVYTIKHRVGYAKNMTYAFTFGTGVTK